MPLNYVAAKLDLSFSDNEAQSLLGYDEDILRYAADRVAFRPNVANKIGLLITICRGCRKEQTSQGAFILDGRNRIPVKKKIEPKQISISNKNQTEQPRDTD